MRIGSAMIWLGGIAAAANADDWPQFRGPTGQGVAGPAPTEWSEELGVQWKTPLPGRAWSSPVVCGGKVWLTTAIENPGEGEAEAESGAPSGHAATDTRVSLRALCVDWETGSVERDIELFEVENADRIHAHNSYASPTPVIEGGAQAPGRLYCHFGTFGNACIDTASGEVVWRRVLKVQHYVGPGSSPVVWGELLVLTYDGADQQFITALDKRTGETVWRTPRPPIRATNPDLQKSYSTPLVIESGGATQMVVTGAQWLVAYNPATGEELWRVDHGSGFSVVPRPVYADGVLYFATGFSGDEVVAVRVDGSGDVTETHVLWRAKRQAPHLCSPVLVGGRLYTVSDNGVCVCLRAATGAPVWKKRLGGAHSASPLLSGDTLYVFGRDGQTRLIRDAEEPSLVGESQLDGRVFATPAVVDGCLLIRTDTHLYRIGGN